MEAKYVWLNAMLNKSKQEFANWPDIRWANAYVTEEHVNLREQLIEENGIASLYKETKPYLKSLSPGCEICGSGKWSCLFITGKCNAHCFYCPAPQIRDEKPSTQGIIFDDPDAYAHYINHFGFDGVSFSGGEPMLTFDRTLSYLKALRKRCHPDLYIWMYTNGLLTNPEKLKMLADANIDEVRFDIGATRFSLDKVEKAKGIIPHITIEIPSVPEEKNRIMAMLPAMIDAGVTNLNLHHLRLTHYNVGNLVKRGYTIIGAERPLVMESELAALEIMAFASAHQLGIGINYCSFHFKNRFQKAGYRKMVARKLFPDAVITENGYIREFTGKDLCYKTVKLSDYHPHLSRERTIWIQGKEYGVALISLFCERDLPGELIQHIHRLLEKEPEEVPDDPILFQIWQYEYIERGLRKY